MKKLAMIMAVFGVMLAYCAGAQATAEMVYISGGEFQMGDHFNEGNHTQRPVHPVSVNSFYMSRNEITNQQYCDYLNAVYPEQIKVISGVVYASTDSGNSYPYCDTTTSSSYSRITWDGSSFSVVSGKTNHPMVMVSWYGAVAYCNFYDYRLPTEAEWEYAARGGERNPYYRYPWGDSIDGSKANYNSSGDLYEGTSPETAPVGDYATNGYGLYDMAGNVWEWCNDWSDENYYSVSPYDNPQGPVSGTNRILRGGSWNDGIEQLLCANRGSHPPDDRFISYGFRVVSSGIIYVDANIPDSNDGSCWDKAYKYIQDALAYASSKDYVAEIRVAQGTYTPDTNSSNPGGTNDRAATFQLISGVALKGGYAGYAKSNPDARDISAYETVLTGDIGTVDVNTDNSYHVVTGSGTDVDTILNGFTITKGNANGSSSDNSGGGMYTNDGNPTITNCTFIGNAASDDAGGMYNTNSNPIVTNCTFHSNTSSDGTGMANRNDSSPIITNCTFTKNIATGTGNNGGGGMLNGESSNPMVINCIFKGNSTSGGSTNNIGGGMYNSNSAPIVINCTFIENVAGDDGGGMCNYNNSTPTVTNCIIWGNTAATGPQIFNDGTSSTIVSYSDVEGSWPGVTNIDSDPRFANPDNGDCHLKSQASRWDGSTKSWVQDGVTSPCIDTGDPDGSIGYELFPNGGRVNMGAYGGTTEASKSYFGGPVCEKNIAGDINGDCIVNFIDFSFMASNWLEDNR